MTIVIADYSCKRTRAPGISVLFNIHGLERQKEVIKICRCKMCVYI